MSKTPPLIVSGVIFTLFSLMHILRLFYHWDVIIAGLVIPMWASSAAFIVAGALAIWMFIAASKA